MTEVLIVEDSENIAKRYSHILDDVIKQNGYSKKVGVLRVHIVDCYKSFVKLGLIGKEFHIAIVDWKLLYGTAEPILKLLNDYCCTYIISGYADEPKFRKLWIRLGVREDHIKDKFIGLQTIESIFKEAINAIQT